MNSPQKVIELNIESAEKKAQMSLSKTLVLAILSGAFIAFGAEGSNLAAHGIADFGLAKLVAGCVFPVGLMLVIILGTELFTGNCLMINGVLDKKIKASDMIKNLLIVFCGNLIGGLLIAISLSFIGQWNASSDLLGAYTIKVAVGKVDLGFAKALVSGILCNILVCLAVLAATASKQIQGKILVIFFIIMLFVVSGFEHSVANMYYLSAGKLASINPDYVNKAVEVYSMSAEQIEESLSVGNLLLKNLLPVTIGNIVGGMLFTAVPLWYGKYRTK